MGLAKDLKQMRVAPDGSSGLARKPRNDDAATSTGTTSFRADVVDRIGLTPGCHSVCVPTEGGRGVRP